MTTRASRAGIKDVARVAGVSVGTVSHVLNRPEMVSERRRQAVLDAITELGYVPNLVARELKGGGSRLIGFVCPNPISAHYATIALGIQREAELRNLDMLSAPTFDDAVRSAHYLSLFERKVARGVIMIPRSLDLVTELATSDRGTPVVLIDISDPLQRLCSVSCDDQASGRLAIEHLATQGRKHIAVLGQAEAHAVQQRWLGAETAAAKIGGLKLELIDLGEQSIAAARAATVELVARPKNQRPDAIFACQAMLGYGVLHALFSDSKLRVPTDMAVVGHDDPIFSAQSIIPMTTIQQFEEQSGRVAVQLLEDKVNNPDHQHQTVQLEPELVVRASSAG